MRLIRGRRGEGMTAREIILTVMALVGFGVILIFVFAFDFESTADDEVCRLSILTRATAPTEAQGVVPLNCKTDKICLTMGSGRCEESFAGEEGVAVIKISEKEAKKVIEQTIAENFYDCWTMMGKGRLDLFGGWATSRGISPTKPVCIICDRVAVDDIPGEIMEKIDIRGYMASTKIPKQSVTYFTAITGKANPSGVVANEYKTKGVKFEKTTKKLDFSNDGGRAELAIVFSQIKVESLTNILKNLRSDALYGGAVGFMTPGVSSIGKLVLTTGPGLVLAGVAAAGTVLNAEYTNYRNQEIVVGHCGEFTSNADKNGKPSDGQGRNGCSLVQTVPYSAKAINQLCPQIEGRP